MKLTGILQGRRKELLERWFQAVADTYPPETSRFLGAEKNRFANPVGFAISQGLAGVLDCLLAGSGPEETREHLDEIVRIRAVQSFSPSASLACLLSLKGIAREVLGERGTADCADDLGVFDDRIDRLLLLAFDNYMDCREKLFEIKVKELKEMVAIQTANAWRREAARGENAQEQKRSAEGQS